MFLSGGVIFRNAAKAIEFIECTEHRDDLTITMR